MTVPVAVRVPGSNGIQTITVSCANGASVLSGFISRLSNNQRQLLAPNIDWGGWPSTRSQWTFVLRNITMGEYNDTVEIGAICANTN